jgi:nucleotide-binding universal stress UspA family protein
MRGAMGCRLLDRVLVPVANQADAEATRRAIEPYLDEIGEIVLVHVVEQTPGYMDHTSPEALREEAEEFLWGARNELGEDVNAEAEIRFGDDVVEELAALAEGADATAIVFHPREKGLLGRFVDGDREGEMIAASPVPVIALTG